MGRVDADVGLLCGSGCFMDWGLLWIGVFYVEADVGKLEILWKRVLYGCGYFIGVGEFMYSKDP